MKTVKLLLISTMALLNFSCAEAKSPKNDTPIKQQLTDDTAYLSSDKKLNETYNKFSIFQSAVLQQSLKNDQNNWLKSRAKTCGVSGLGQPTNDIQESCFIAENEKRINQLNAKFANLQDLVNGDFKLLEENSKKLIPSSQAYCMCGKNSPFIDLKNNTFSLVNVCDKTKVVQKDPIQKIIFGEDSIDFQMANQYGTSYHVIFKPQANTYLIITGGDWGVIKDLNLPAYVTPLKNQHLNIKEICGDFDG